MALAFGLFAGWVYAKFPGTYPDTPTVDVVASDDPEVIARGEYLFHAVAHCSACHAEREEVAALQAGDRATPSGAAMPMGPLGTLYSANLTSDEATGIGKRSDAELARTIAHAVLPDDRPALMMFAVGPMAREDLEAVISYMRTIEPVTKNKSDHELSFLGRALMATVASELASPTPAFETPPYVPPGEVSAARGRYLSEGPAGCFGCHNEHEGTTMIGSPFCGSNEAFPDEDGHELRAPNITTGGKLSGITEADFVKRMRAPRMYTGSPMPWENYRSMTDEDLRSIYQHLANQPSCDAQIVVYR